MKASTLTAMATALLASLLWLAPASAEAGDLDPTTATSLNPCGAKANPCGGKANPCNPCGGKANPCNPCGGGSVDASRFQQPPGVKLARAPHSELVAEGEKLWNDRALGTSGIACATCHIGGYGQMNDTFDAPFPHRVAMPAQQAGVAQVNAAEMVNFCMIVPMQDEPLAWESRELAALTAYVEKLQAGFEPGAAAAANPCNPCGAKANPCNPCGAKANPCNPCAGG